MDSWNRQVLMVQTGTHGIDLNLWYRYGLIVQKGIDIEGIDMSHGIDMISWFLQHPWY